MLVLSQTQSKRKIFSCEPCTPTANGNVKDRGNTTVEIMADLREILLEIKSDPQWD